MSTDEARERWLTSSTVWNDCTEEPTADFEAARARWEAAEDAEEATVEVVARAIADSDGSDYDYLNDRQDPKADSYRDMARAAIDAITTPVRQEAAHG